MVATAQLAKRATSALLASFLAGALLNGLLVTTGHAQGAPASANAAGDGKASPVEDGKASPEEIASVAAVKARAAKADYERGRWDPIHFKPAIDFAKDEACLVCHSEVMSDKPRASSPAGVKASELEAWYQTLSTYAGQQETFHWRHLQSPYAKQVMNLSCNFCHQGNDPRERSPHVTATNPDGTNNSSWNNNLPAFPLRKNVNVAATCLRCHGSYPAERMGLEGTWPQLRTDLETPDTPNGCLTCHGETFRTNRHQVTYLKPDAIEKLAKDNSDVCYGCHGGRQWYRISYPYPRHPWPNMPDETPDWAKDRPTQSDARFQLPDSSKQPDVKQPDANQPAK